MTIRRNLFGAAALLMLLGSILQGETAYAQPKNQLRNNAYQVAVLKDGSIRLTARGTTVSAVFSPSFMIMYRENSPGLRYARAREAAFVVPAWKALNGKGNTTAYFETADTVTVKPIRSVVKNNTLTWTFSQSPDFTLEAELSLPPGEEAPGIRYRLKARKPGWYSVGYTGAPVTSPSAMHAIWQPLVWQEQRFPSRSFLSMEYMCSIPSALVNKDGYTLGVAADPAEIPFRFPTRSNSRFGVLVRNAGGDAQPMIFAPVLGGAASRLEAGDTASFRCRLIARKGDLFNAYKYIAQTVLGFHDYRKNATCSLNETLENMIDYAMNDFYSGWNAELKAPDYATDVPGTVKLVSALHPLSIAMITDNEQVYRRRALPMIEYLMSREKYLFTTEVGATHQSPSHYLKGPAANVSELAALYEMSQNQSTVFKYYAQELYGKPRVLNLKMISKGDSWQNSLALYRMSGDRQYLEKAEAGADAYIAARIDKLQTDFSDVHVENGGQFWTDFAPKWIDLLELYETTREKRYLDAAVKGAELFVEYIWMEPAPPEKDVLINKGGKVGMYAHQNRLNADPQPMEAPEQTVPAWRVSQTGLISEASTTYGANRAVFLTHYAAYLLRLAAYTGESYFHDIARAAVVGRYANFPGYSIMGEYTTIYSRPDYPARSLWDITYNNIYYNHIWPQIALLMDYLVSDANTLSKGKINFPSQYAQGYAYLQSDVYGSQPGVFYGNRNVRLWMPAKLLRTDNIQANYIAGYGNGNLYIALMNQSPGDIRVKVRLNPDLVPFSEQQVYKVRVWKNNGSVTTATMQHGEITIPLGAHGITAFSIADLPVRPQFQDKILKAGDPLPPQSHATEDTPLGKVHGMIIDMGPSLTNSYIYLQATEKELKEVRFYYLEKGKWKKVTDTTYPYELSVPLTHAAPDFQYRVEGVDLKGNVLRTEQMKLERR